jgi:site-specific recombinase XerD
MLQARNLSASTVGSYVSTVAKISLFHKKSPLLFTENEVLAFLLHELKVQKLEPKTVELHRCALITFYRMMAPEITIMQKCGRIKIPHKLPTVLSREEVERMIDGIRNRKHRAITAVLYSSGLRLNECAKLKPADIDCDRMTVRVEAGKGLKDRYAVLSHRALELLKEYQTAYRASEWLFPGRSAHISGRSIQYVVATAASNAGIRKRVHPHTLRHSFATHLIEAGVPLQIIQLFLGHENLKTTAEYAHISSTMVSGVSSPFDMAMRSTPEATNV